ncbi:MAG TPA: response regulator transcription factor [Bacteroidia bacterium]|nr:response regulator transcription factor [Bacteroidia bacterium]
MKKNLRILIADDHPLIRKGISQMLTEEFAGVKIGEAKDGSELLEKSRKENWDFVITDLSMPGRSELETVKQLKTENPLLPVLILSMYPEEQYAKRMLKAGASGYLLKDSAPEELCNAVRQILSGKKYFSENVAQLLAEDAASGKKDAPVHELLSDRELEVFKLIASGKTVSEIAGKLSLSVPTISTYRARILVKLNLKNNSELTHFAISNGLI